MPLAISWCGPTKTDNTHENHNPSVDSNRSGTCQGHCTNCSAVIAGRWDGCCFYWLIIVPVEPCSQCMIWHVKGMVIFDWECWYSHLGNIWPCTSQTWDYLHFPHVIEIYFLFFCCYVCAAFSLTYVTCYIGYIYCIQNMSTYLCELIYWYLEQQNK